MPAPANPRKRDFFVYTSVQTDKVLAPLQLPYVVLCAFPLSS
jgi:hypothetical protein